MKIGFDKSNIDDVFSPCLDKEKLKPLTDSYNFLVIGHQYFMKKMVNS
ncbi:hypothetical protein [Clostridium coskatii]|nr:hypothetical protein [Clostridium coskatii]